MFLFANIHKLTLFRSHHRFSVGTDLSQLDLSISISIGAEGKAGVQGAEECPGGSQNLSPELHFTTVYCTTLPYLEGAGCQIGFSGIKVILELQY